MPVFMDNFSNKIKLFQHISIPTEQETKAVYASLNAVVSLNGLSCWDNFTDKKQSNVQRRNKFSKSKHGKTNTNKYFL